MDDLLSMNRSSLLQFLKNYFHGHEEGEKQEDSVLQEFSNNYVKIHGYASLVTIVFGVLTNILVITILQQKKMKTPTNLILSALALFDMLTMIPYIPFAVKFYVIYSANEVPPEVWTVEWVQFAAFVLSFTATTHTISIWLVVNLAVLRYVQVKKSASSAPSYIHAKMMILAKRLVVCTTVASVLIMIPHYLTHEITSQTIKNNITFYTLKEHKLASADTKPLVLTNFLVYAITAKIIPCLLMLIFGGLLMYNVGIKSRLRRKKLLNTKRKKDHRSSSTTATLLLVIILFLITEGPQGILMIISTVVPDFYTNVYIPLGDVMDFAALLNNSVNFILYCSMSAQFRHTFLRIYVHPSLRRCKRG